MRKFLSGLVALVFLSGAVAAQTVHVALPDTTGQVGETITIPLAVQDSVTGLEIYSAEGTITYDPSLLDLDTVSLGSMANGWSLVFNASTPGVIHFAMASGNPLEGIGDLLLLKFTPTNSGNSPLSFTDFMFNTGTPAVETSDGSILIYPPTGVDVSMPYVNVAVDGNVDVPVQINTDVTGLGIYSVEFNIAYDPNVVEVDTVLLTDMTSGWSLAYNTTTPGTLAIALAGGVALIGTGDLLTVTYHAIGEDGSYSDLTFANFIFNNGLPVPILHNGRIYVGTPNVLGVSFPEGYVTPGNLETICVNLDSVATSSQNVLAFEFAFFYDPNVLTPVSYEAGDSIPESWIVTANLNYAPGEIMVAAAGSDPIVGGPEPLVCFTFQVIGGECDTSDLTFDFFTWNNGLPAPEWTDGMVIASTTPAAPTLSEPANGLCTSNTTPTFSWSDVAPDGSYHLLVATDEAFTDSLIVIDESLTDNFYTPHTPLDEGTYYWKVNGITACGREGIFSDTWSFNVDITAPDAVTLLSPPDGYYTNSTDVSLTWATGSDVGCGINHYVIQLDEDQTFQTPEQWTTTDTTFPIPFSLTDHVYYWRVKAVDEASNEGDWSEVWNFEVDTQSPNAPTLASPIGGVFLNSSPVAFEWGAVTFAPRKGKSKAGILSPVEYVLQIDTTLDFSAPLVIDTVTETQASEDLVEGSYYWRVKAFDLAGNEGGYSTDSFNLDLNAPGTVTLISPPMGAMINDATPEFIWNSVLDDFSGTDHYVLQIDVGPAFLNPSEYEVTDTTYTLETNLTDGVYYWRVRAVDKAGNEGNWGGFNLFNLDATVPAAPIPLSPVGGFLGTLSVTFNWTQVTIPSRVIGKEKEASIKSPVHYVLTVMNTDYEPYFVDTLIETSDTKTVPISGYGIVYWFVYAFDEAGNVSPTSDTVSFGIDVSSPRISNTTFLQDTSYAGPFEVTTEVRETPEIEAGVAEVRLYFQINGGDWVASIMDQVDSVTYSGEIPGPLGPNTPVKYYIEAIDAAEPANVSTDPVGAPDTVYEFIATGIHESSSIPRAFSFSISPNPARNAVQIQLALPEKSDVNVKIYDASGKLVRRLISGVQPAGIHRFNWNGYDNHGNKVSSGVYFLKVSAGSHHTTQKVLITRE